MMHRTGNRFTTSSRIEQTYASVRHTIQRVARSRPKLTHQGAAGIVLTPPAFRVAIKYLASVRLIAFPLLATHKRIRNNQTLSHKSITSHSALQATANSQSTKTVPLDCSTAKLSQTVIPYRANESRLFNQMNLHRSSRALVPIMSSISNTASTILNA